MLHYQIRLDGSLSDSFEKHTQFLSFLFYLLLLFLLLLSFFHQYKFFLYLLYLIRQLHLIEWFFREPEFPKIATKPLSGNSKVAELMA